MVVPPGFEPGSRDPESRMMDRYTKGLVRHGVGQDISRKPSAMVPYSSPESRINCIKTLSAGPLHFFFELYQRGFRQAK